MKVVITGASRGIGYQTALQLVQKKISLLILIARSADKLAMLENECRHLSHNLEIVSIPYNIEEIFDDNSSVEHLLRKHTDTIDILINNAGYLESIHFEQTEIESARKMFNVNFFAAAELIRQMLPFFRTSSLSHIVNIGSMAGFQGSSKFIGLSYYSASKAALACLSECLAEEFKDRNITCNCLALGAVQTEMLTEAFPRYKAPLTAQQMGAFIADFAINGQKYFNGKTLPISLSTP